MATLSFLGFLFDFAIFQKLVNDILGNLRYGKTIASMDDVLLYSISFGLEKCFIKTSTGWSNFVFA